MPAQHGGFETFAKYLCLHMLKRGWHVTVYCQEKGSGQVYETEWRGVRRVHVPVRVNGPIGSVVFDLISVVDSRRRNGIVLTLGYNTALFGLLHRIWGQYQIINMDGLEWKRSKWSRPVQLWFRLNEWIACRTGDRLIADNPGIAEHLSGTSTSVKMVTIPYGGRDISQAEAKVLDRYSLSKYGYAIVVARPEPENSILELVRAFSQRIRGIRLVVLGDYYPDSNVFHRNVIRSASDEILFLGSIYDEDILNALRFYARFYMHGHQVGGTNPSLVEALGAGSAILCHDNRFNRWVAGDSALYFTDIDGAANAIDVLTTDDELITRLREEARLRFRANFRWNDVLSHYEALLSEAAGAV